MRKNITLSLAVAGLMAFGASAAVQPENVKFSENTVFLNREFKTGDISLKAPAFANKLKAPAKVSPVNITTNKLREGEYGWNTVLVQNSANGRQTTRFGIYSAIMSYNEAQLPENTLLLYMPTFQALLPDDVDDVNIYMVVYDPTDRTLTIPAGQCIWEEDDAQYGHLEIGIYPAKYEDRDGATYIVPYDGDIVFKYDGNQFVLEETDEVSNWLWFGDVDGVGYGYFADINLTPANLSGATTLDLNGRSYRYGFYGWADVKEDKLLVRDFFGFTANTLMEMTIDRTAKTITSDHQIVVSEDDSDYYWANDAAEPLVVAPYEVKSEELNGEVMNYTVVTLGEDQLTTVIDPVTNYYFGLYSKTNFTLFFDIDDTTGIEAVEAADNSNAPVEYFNIQGVKVNGDNLNNGVYIRRQGSDVQKVMVK